MRDPPPDVAAYLAAAPEAHRDALTRLRKVILAAAPAATERLSYGMPAFFVGGRPLACIASFRNHCSLFGGYLAAGIARRYPGVVVERSTVRFTPAAPLPVALVKEIVRAQVEAASRKAPRKPSRPATPGASHKPPANPPARRARAAAPKAKPGRRAKR